MDFLCKLRVFAGEHAESVIEVANPLEVFANSQKVSLRYTFVWATKCVDFLWKIRVFGGEHAESAIGIATSLEAFREVAESVLQIKNRMGSEMYGSLIEHIGVRWCTCRK